MKLEDNSFLAGSESENGVSQSCQILCDPMDCSLPGFSMGFSRHKYWCGLPFPSPGDLPNPGIEPGSLALQADALTSELPGKPSSGKSFESLKFSHSVVFNSL